MDYSLVTGLAKWFILRQVGKFVEKIDWSKVADDFIDRISDLLPKEVFGSVERVNTRDFVLGFGKKYESMGLAAMYGQGQFIAAFGACFGDTAAAKLSASQESYLASLKPVEAKPVEVAEAKPVEVAEVEPEKEEKGGFLGMSGKNDKKGSKKT